MQNKVICEERKYIQLRKEEPQMTMRPLFPPIIRQGHEKYLPLCATHSAVPVIFIIKE